MHGAGDDGDSDLGEELGLPSGRVYPPVTAEQVKKTEAILGFKLPRLLTRLYVEVANGGFGPGYGLFGLEGGFTDEDQRLTLVELYQSWADPPEGPLPPPPWPKKLVQPYGLAPRTRNLTVLGCQVGASGVYGR